MAKRGVFLDLCKRKKSENEKKKMIKTKVDDCCYLLSHPLSPPSLFELIKSPNGPNFFDVFCF